MVAPPRLPPVLRREALREALPGMVDLIARRRAVLLLHPGDAQLLGHAPLAIAARREPLRLAQRIGRIVDIAAFRESVRDRRQVRLSLPTPAAFPHLARKVGAELRPGRREPPDVAERKLLQLRLIQRRDRASGLSMTVHALFVP